MLMLPDATARDLMQTHVVTFTRSTPIQSAIATLEELHIGGAPVVDEAGRVVGMLSASDVAKCEHMRDDRIETEAGEYSSFGLDDDEQREYERLVPGSHGFSPSSVERTTVGEWMSADVIAVDPERKIQAICRLMVREHVHRLPVIEEGTLVGILTTLDILGWIAGNVPDRATGARGGAARERATPGSQGSAAHGGSARRSGANRPRG